MNDGVVNDEVIIYGLINYEAAIKRLTGAVNEFTSV